MKIKKGTSLKMSGSEGLKDVLQEKFHEKRHAAYKNLSPSEKKLFEQTLIDAAKKKATGSAFTSREKKKMRQELWEEQKRGTISKEDREDFNKIISELE